MPINFSAKLLTHKIVPRLLFLFFFQEEYHVCREGKKESLKTLKKRLKQNENTLSNRRVSFYFFLWHLNEPASEVGIL